MRTLELLKIMSLEELYETLRRNEGQKYLGRVELMAEILLREHDSNSSQFKPDSKSCQKDNS